MRFQAKILSSICCASLALGASIVQPIDAQSPTVEVSTDPNASAIETSPIVNQFTRPWSLESLTDRALQTHPALAEISSKIDAAYGAYVQAGLQPNPTIGYQGQQIGSGGLAEQHGVSFGRDIVRSEKIQRSQAVAAAEQQRLQFELEVMRHRVQTDLRIAYFHAIAAQKQYTLSKELYEVAEKGEKLAEQLREAKEVSKIDVLQTSLEKEKATVGIENASNRVRATWQAIAALTGLPANCPEELDQHDPLPPCNYDFCEVLTCLRANSPEITAAQATIQRNREIVARARVEPLPNVNVQGLINWQDNGIGGKPDGGIQIAVPIPVRNKNQGAIHQAIAELRAAEFSLQKLELDLQNRLAATFERYANAKSQEKLFNEKMLPKAKESLELTRLAYRENDITFLALLSAQRTYFEMSLSSLEATRQRRIAEAEMDGMLLVGSLQKQ